MTCDAFLACFEELVFGELTLPEKRPADERDDVARSLPHRHLPKILEAGPRRRQQELRFPNIALQSAKIDRLPSTSHEDIDLFIVAAVQPP
jgi:hypothetical protein